MHDYAIDSRERVFVVRILFMSSALVSGVAAALMPSDLIPMRWLLPIPSMALVFGVSYWAFDNWLWRLQFLRALRLAVDKRAGPARYMGGNGCQFLYGI